MNTLLGLLLSASLFAWGGMNTMPSQHSDSSAFAEHHISYETVKSPYPNAAKTAWESIRKQGGYRVSTDGQKTYVAIGLGKRSTGGYSVSVTNVTQTAKGEIVVKAHENRPKPGAMTTQALTYPSVIIALPKTSKPIKVVME
ncbi:MAG: protease complex subunit PrcB family protein [Clostridia bacterium]